jgi:micrococcal nuclease
VLDDPVAVDIDMHPDAAGDDNVNLNDEWVRFVNAGDTDLDLEQWTVADESATHRYTFAELVLAPGAAVTLFTGCGTDTDSERYWCNTDSAVWNNRGDTVFLRDPAGNIVASRTY